MRINIEKSYFDILVKNSLPTFCVTERPNLEVEIYFDLIKIRHTITFEMGEQTMHAKNRSKT